MFPGIFKLVLAEPKVLYLTTAAFSRDFGPRGTKTAVFSRDVGPRGTRTAVFSRDMGIYGCKTRAHMRA